MTPRPRFLAARCAAALLTALTLSGCGADRDVLARVGDSVITIADFDAIAESGASRYPGPPDSAKAQLLDDLVTRALLVEEARRQGYLSDSSAVRHRRAIEDRAIVEALLARLAPTDVPVSAAEVEAFHAARAIEARLHVVFVPNRDAAVGARADLARGADFAEIADRYNLGGFLPDGGDLGWIVPGSIVNPLDDVVQHAPVGALQGPLRAPGEGWLLAVVSERRPREQPGVDEQRSVLREMIRQRKFRTVRQQAIESLRAQYRVRLEPGAAQAVFRRANASFGGAAAPPLTDEERAVVLARYDDVEGRPLAYTMGDANDDLSDPEIERPNFAMVPILQQWIETQVVRRVAKIEARRRRIHEEPDVARRVRERFHGEAVDQLYSREVLVPVQLEPGDVRATYERMADQFTRLDEVRLAWALVPDSAAAAAIAARAATAPLAPGGDVRDDTVRFPTTIERWALLQATFMATPPGAVVGPYPLEGGWFVAQILAKRQERQPFDRLEPAFVNMLETQALEEKREARLREWTARLSAAFKPEVHPEKLRRARWPAGVAG